MAITFDGYNKIATLSSGTTVLSVLDIWSRWADWIILSDNSKYLPMFTTIGGDTIDQSSGTTIPIYAFLLNGWRIRPQESNHNLNIVSGILLVDGGGDPFINTIGSFNIRINYSQPVQAITVSTGGGGSLTATDIRDAIWSAPISTLTDKTTIGGYISKLLLSIPKFIGLK